MDTLRDISFFLPKYSKQHPNLLGVHGFGKESIGAAFITNTLNLKNGVAETEILTKYFEKRKLL